jgi:acyl carrier protein
MADETLSELVERLVLEYAQTAPPARPLDPGLSLRDDLAVESLSLVSLTLRIGDELGVDVLEAGLELGDVRTIADLVGVAEKMRAFRQASGSP